MATLDHLAIIRFECTLYEYRRIIRKIQYHRAITDKNSNQR